MSKHPIDDLFTSQLSNHGVKPERASWDELQRRMNAKEARKTPFLRWYSAAASVAVVLLGSWWLWSGEGLHETASGTNQVAQQTPKKLVPSTPAKTVPPETDEAKPLAEPLVADQKTVVSREENRLVKHRPSGSTKPAENRASPPVTPSETPVLAEASPKEKSVKPDARMEEVAPKQSERTLVVQIAAAEIKSSEAVASAESGSSERFEADEEQPRKKRFRLGRVLRQINKLKAGERVEWEEIGVQPGTLMARASEKVQEGKEKISDSYENLRYNTFRKNSNNK
ncbi:hypothetical protein GCM10027299_17740 [Larkinella ripae]